MKFPKKCKKKLSTKILNNKWQIKKQGNSTKTTKQDMK